jgi:hypothetical protein
MKSRADKKHLKVRLTDMIANMLEAQTGVLAHQFPGHTFTVRRVPGSVDVSLFIKGEFGGLDMITITPKEVQ